MRCSGRTVDWRADVPDGRADDNANALSDFADASSWLGFLAVDPATRSNTSVCLKIADPDVLPRWTRTRRRLCQGYCLNAGSRRRRA